MATKLSQIIVRSKELVDTVLSEQLNHYIFTSDEEYVMWLTSMLVESRRKIKELENGDSK